MDDPIQKISRAKKYLEALRDELRAFGDSHTHTVSREDDLKNKRHVLRTKILPCPPEIYLLLGDAFYNLRASLDQLVYSLASLTVDLPIRTSFPVLERWNTKTRDTFEQAVAGVPDEAKFLIQSFQPYHRGDAFKTHPLWRLNEMCNLDKHRRIPANGHYGDFALPNVTDEDMASGLVQFDEFHNGAIVSVPLTMKHKLDFDPHLTITVNFGGGHTGINETPAGIAEIYSFVAKEVFPAFRKFFPEQL